MDSTSGASACGRHGAGVRGRHRSALCSWKRPVRPRGGTSFPPEPGLRMPREPLRGRGRPTLGRGAGPLQLQVGQAGGRADCPGEGWRRQARPPGRPRAERLAGLLGPHVPHHGPTTGWPPGVGSDRRFPIPSPPALRLTCRLALPGAGGTAGPWARAAGQGPQGGGTIFPHPHRRILWGSI